MFGKSRRRGELVARQAIADSGPLDQLLVYCDAARGNLVYVAQSYRGVSVNVVFDPERCAPKETKWESTTRSWAGTSTAACSA